MWFGKRSKLPNSNIPSPETKRGTEKEQAIDLKLPRGSLPSGKTFISHLAEGKIYRIFEGNLQKNSKSRGFLTYLGEVFLRERLSSWLL